MSTAVCIPSSSPSLSTRPAVIPAAVRRGAWQLDHGQAISLKASGTSVLRVRQGRVWVTRDADARRASEDLVLGPGETLTLASGERIVMEPWDGYGATYTWDAG